MRKLIVLLFAFISCITVSAQKSPYHIRNYKPSEYGGYNQTWQIVQDQQGLIFIASTTSIVVYDGVTWQGIQVKLGAATRQIYLDTSSGTMYVGSVQEFGCIERDSQGYFLYHSFMDQLKPEESVFTDVWKVEQKGDKIYFQSAEHIFVVQNKKVIGRIDPQEGSTFALMFNCGGRLFVRQRGVGLMEINDRSITLVPNSEMFATTRLMGMLRMDANTNYLLTNDMGFVQMSNANSSSPQFEYLKTQPDSFLMLSGVLGAEWISENEYAVFSRFGLTIYTREGKKKAYFNKANGLGDESISEVFVDREKNIWLATNNGFSMISYSAPALFYDQDYGFKGTIETLDFVGDTVYLASSAGLFQSIPTEPGVKSMNFTRIPFVPNEAWDILVAENSILVSASSGLYEIGQNVREHMSERYTNTALWIDTGSVVLTAEKGGFAVFSRKDGQPWKEEEYFEMPGIELIRISAPAKTSEPNVYRFSGTTRFKSVLHIEFNYVDSSMTVRTYDERNGLGSRDFFPVTINDSVYMFGYRTVFRYKPEKDLNDSSVCYVEAPDIFAKVYGGNTTGIRTFSDYRMFLEHPETEPYTTFFGPSANGVVAARLLLGRLFQGNNIQLGRIADESDVWILNNEAIVRYDLNYKIDTAAKFDAIITRVHFAGDTNFIYFPLEEVEVPYGKNSVDFHFAAPYFKYNMQCYYRYQLLGYDTGWSEKTMKPEKEYTNLPEGTYTFVVEAASPFNIGSTQARFVFTVLPPWYRTTWAYIGYLVVLFLFIYAVVRISARNLRKQKERLEQIVKERTAEVEKQKVDLEEAYTGIQDSIQYSQRIQNAILPTTEEIKRIVPDSFVLFFPRDIVSGDFYWFAEKNARPDDPVGRGLKYIACVDCTGHGVPGALMSMIGNTILNQIVIEKNISAPDQILNHLHVGVRHALKQDIGGDTRDGMDLSIIVLDHDCKTLKYAGANRNLWIVRNKELIEIKADKFPIAGSQQEEERRFTAHTIDLQKGDMIYMTTDGYADQFGGPKGKKFMVKQFTRLLAEIHTQPINDQRFRLEQEFFAWKQNHEQVDDVLVIGIRV